MITKLSGSKTILAVAAFIWLASLSRHANAMLNNVPYVVNGKALTVMSGTAGSAATFNNMLYIAYIAPDGNIGILADSNLGGNGQNVVYSYEIGVDALGFEGTWEGGYGTALVSYNGTLYLFFQAVSYCCDAEFSHLQMATSTDGAHWSQQYIAGYPNNSLYFDTPPTAVVWEGQILVYINEGGSNLDQFNIVGTTSSGPYTWLGGQTYSTTARASATVWQGQLCLSISDAARGNEIGMLYYTDATGWSSETLTGLYGIPNIYPLGAGPLNMVYRPTNYHLYSTWTSNGVSFSTPQEDTRSTTYRAPVQFAPWSVSYSNWTFYVGENNELFTVLE